MRIGEALGLRHNESPPPNGGHGAPPRDNDNGARAKSVTSRTIPVGAELIRLYADYLHDEYGDLDSDYVFVNLWGQPRGHPLTYAGGLRPGAAAAPADRDRLRPALASAHRGDPDAARRRTGSRSCQRSRSRVGRHDEPTYGHLSVEDARRVMEQAGWFTG